MSQMSQQLPFKTIVQTLCQYCQQRKTGTFLVITHQNHALRFYLNNGEIKAIIYGINQLSYESLSRLLTIKSGKFQFAEHIGPPKAIASTLPSNQKIFEALGLSSYIDDQIQSPKILVVEDSTTTRNFICRMLRHQHYQVIEAQCGFEALSKLIHEPPDLILLDIMMPDIDGYKVLNTLKKHPKLHDIPVIMLTSRNSLFDKIKGKHSEACSYLTKPFDQTTLLQTIENAL